MTLRTVHCGNALACDRQFYVAIFALKWVGKAQRASLNKDVTMHLNAAYPVAIG
jgi:hypothetical protein